MSYGCNKVLLVNYAMYDAAIEKLGTVHEQLFSEIDTKFHEYVFQSHSRVQLASRQNDNISSCNYSSYANDLLSVYQDLDTNTADSPHKHPRVVHLSYSAAVSTTSNAPSAISSPGPTITPTTVSLLTNQDMDALFLRLKPYLVSDSVAMVYRSS